MRIVATGLPNDIPEEVQTEIGRRVLLEINAFGYPVDGIKVVFEKDS